MKVKKLKIASLCTFCLLSSSAVLFSQTESTEGDADESPLSLDLELKTSVANDYSDATFGVGWDLRFEKSRVLDSGDAGGDDPYWNVAFDVELLSKGSWLEDEELNRDPITLSARAFLFARRLTPAAGGFDGGVIPDDPFGDAFDDEEEEEPVEEVTNGRSIQDFWALGGGLDAGMEADQSFDNLAYRISAFAMFHNQYHFRQIELKNGTDRLLNFIPTVELALDAVHRAETDLPMGAAMPDDDYFRVRAVASWRYYLGQHFGGSDSGKSWLDPLELYTSLQYSHDIDQNSAWQSTGDDESLGWLVELTYDMNDIEGMVLFARASGGRIAPILEDDKSLLFGARYRF